MLFRSTVTSSTGVANLVFSGTDPLSIGSQITVQAVINQSAVGTLSCALYELSAVGDAPLVGVQLAAAMGTSVNDSNATYANFTMTTPPV